MQKEMKYKQGDIVIFDFKPHALDLAREVTLVGVIDGILYAEKGYNVRIADDKRNINGYVFVPEEAITAMIAD